MFLCVCLCVRGYFDGEMFQGEKCWRNGERQAGWTARGGLVLHLHNTSSYSLCAENRSRPTVFKDTLNGSQRVKHLGEADWHQHRCKRVTYVKSLDWAKTSYLTNTCCTGGGSAYNATGHRSLELSWIDDWTNLAFKMFRLSLSSEHWSSKPPFLFVVVVLHLSAAAGHRAALRRHRSEEFHCSTVHLCQFPVL